MENDKQEPSHDGDGAKDADRQTSGPGHESFTPPEAVAKNEETLNETSTTGALDSSPVGPKHWWRRIHLTKKQWIIVGFVTVALIGVGTTTYALLRNPPPKPVAHKQLKKKVLITAVPTTVPSTLTGLPVTPSVNQRPVTAVMIENSTFARPQSGLDQAGVVFEAIAEGGITRFVALYQDTTPSYVGPVRSVRPYYLQWLLGFDAAIAHVGGSPEALQDIPNWNVKDLNQFYNSNYFTRISSRAAPHNVYTSIAQLNALEASKGYTTSNFTGFPRKADQPSKTPDAKTINFTLSGPDYNAQYQYDPSANDYKRSEGGAPHMEINSAGVQTQITPKVVIGMVMTYGLESDDLHSSYATIGSGPVYIFQDGTVTQGTWHKTSNTAQITFTDSKGATINLNAGYTWFTALAATSDVSYQ
ncbi:MAG TPA: DUF3048 domain-containing protein [Candidatus Saccharimonadales bacterium]|nr:DUF3048 domain-containing protein [Candidatus Saccharimonadales bacterium]